MKVYNFQRIENYFSFQYVSLRLLLKQLPDRKTIIKGLRENGNYFYQDDYTENLIILPDHISLLNLIHSPKPFPEINRRGVKEFGWLWYILNRQVSGITSNEIELLGIPKNQPWVRDIIMFTVYRILVWMKANKLV